MMTKGGVTIEHILQRRKRGAFMAISVASTVVGSVYEQQLYLMIQDVGTILNDVSLALRDGISWSSLMYYYHCTTSTS